MALARAPRAIWLWVVLANAGWAGGLALPADMVPLDSPDGQRLLLEAKANQDFFKLVSHLETQKTQSFCGVATSVTILNALPLPAPEVAAWAPFHAFTQDNVFDRGQKVITADLVNRGGMTLHQIGQLLQAQGAEARVVYAAETNLEDFRKLLAESLAKPDDYLLVNFLRSALDQEPKGPVEGLVAGHFSPIAAYNEKADKVLMLDVARYKYPPAWMDVPALWAAVDTRDLASGMTRGFVVVSVGNGPREGAIQPKGGRIGLLLLAVLGVTFLLGAGVGAGVARWRLRRSR